MIIFRAISEEEKNDIETSFEFKPKTGGYEGKLFAESFRSAFTFGKNFFPFDNKPFFIIKVTIDNDEFSKQLGIEYPDQVLGVGSTIAVDREQLADFNNNMTFKIYNYVPSK